MRAPLAGLVVAVLACNGTTPPDRPDPYDYAIRLENGPILSFRWPMTSLPVRFWVQPGTDLRYLVEAAILEWEGAALYGEFTGTIVTDSTRADVRIRIGESFSTNQTQQRSCGSSTFIAVERDTTIALPFVISLFPRAGVGGGDVVECFALATTHEIGHTLGLFLHSDDPRDLMHRRPSLDGISPRDQATFSTLYHSPVSVRLPPTR